MARRSKKSKGGAARWSEAEVTKRINKEGNYAFKIVGAELGESNSGNEQWIVSCECTEDGQFEGAKQKIYFSLEPQALWKLAQLMDAIGVDVPDDDAELDPDDFVDKEFIGSVEENEYRGETNFRVQKFFSADEDAGEKKSSKDKKGAKDEDDGEKEEGKRGRGRPKGSKNKPKDEKAEEPENLDAKAIKKAIKDLDEDQLRTLAVATEAMTEKKAKKADEDDLREAISELDITEDDLDTAIEEASGEPEKEEKGRAQSSKKDKDKGGKKKKVTADEVNDLDEEGLDDLISKFDLEVEGYDAAKTLRKKVALVLDVLEEKGHLED